MKEPQRSRRVRIDLAYDGTDFAGWQVQPGLRTVQGVLEEAMSRIAGRKAGVRGAGRTDAGVHARRQVADCEIGTRLDDGALAHALRRMLPSDVRPLRVLTVGPGFNARKDAASKTYCYELDRTAAGDPFLARYALHHPWPLAVAAIQQGLGQLEGFHDWSGFTGAPCRVKDRRRRMLSAQYEESPAERARFSFTADGFLTHMARNLVGTLLEIGRGHMPAGRVSEILDTRDRRLAGPTAPARGLCLWAVAYGKEG